MKRIIILTIAFWASFQIANGQVSTEHLNAYLWEYPLQQSLVIEPELMEELVEEIEKIIQSGDLFFRPLPNDYADQFDDSYFLYREPGRILQTIALAYPYLEPTMQATLRTMVQQLFANTVHQPWAIVPGQPWEHYLLPVDAGKQRKSFTPANIWGIAITDAIAPPYRIFTMCGYMPIEQGMRPQCSLTTTQSELSMIIK
jgi:hypothetical protein